MAGWAIVLDNFYGDPRSFTFLKFRLDEQIP